MADNQKFLEKETAKATRWSTITEIIVRLVLPLVNMVLARLLTPEAFGVVATVMIVISFAEIFADAGFQKYLIQHQFKDNIEQDENFNVAFWTNFVISLLIWFLIFLFADQLAVLVGNPGLGRVIVVSALALPLISLSSIQLASFKKHLDFRSLFYVRLVSINVPLFVTLPLAFATHSYWSLVLGTLASHTINAVVLSLKSKWHPSFYYSIKQFKKMFSYSWWILLESISIWMMSSLDTFIVGIYLSSYYVGLYKTSMVLVGQIIGLITAATSMPLFVALSRLQNDRKELISTYNNYMQAIGMFVIPLSAGLWIYRNLVTEILLGDKWMEASGFIGLWGLLSSIALVFGTYANGLYNAIGKTFLSFTISTINVALLIPTISYFAPLGFEPLYISRCSLRIVFVVLQLTVMGVALKYPILKFIAKMKIPFVCTFLMSVLGLMMCRLSDNMLWQIFSVLCCVLFYFAISKFLFSSVLENSLNILGLNITNNLLVRWKKFRN